MGPTRFVVGTLGIAALVLLLTTRSRPPVPPEDAAIPGAAAGVSRAQTTTAPASRIAMTTATGVGAAPASPWDRPPTRLRATLREPGGAPLANRYVDFRLILADSEEAFSLQTTDAVGNFEWPVSRRSAQVVPARSVTYTVAPWSAKALTITVPLARPLVAGTDDLGVLTLAPPPLVASGRVVDPRGVPHANGEVRAYAPVLQSDRSADLASDDSRRWNTPWPLVQAVTDAQGAFELRGEWPHATLALLADPPEGLAGTLTPVANGARGIELVVERAAAVAGSCLLDDPASAESVSIEASDGSETTRTQRAAVHPSGDGSFRIPRLRPGPGQVVVRSGDRELVRVSDLVLVSGVTTEDPRLRGIDARRGHRVLTVTVVDARGAPLWCTSVDAVVEGAVVSSATTDREGRARIEVPTLPARLWIHDEAYRVDVCHAPKLVSVTSADPQIPLADGPMVRLRLDTTLPVPAEFRIGERLVTLTQARPEGAPIDPTLFGPGAMQLGYAPIRAGDAFSVPGAGTYRVQCDLQDADGHTVPIGCEPGSLVVSGSAGVEEFTLCVSAHDLREAIRYLRK